MCFSKNKVDSTSDFEAFKGTFPDWETTFGVYDRDNSTVYRRIDCVWKEASIESHYHPVINVKTGEIFLDCRRRKIFAKNLTLILLRPFHIAIKTLWHACIVGPAAFEIYKTLDGKQTAGQALKNSFHSLTDIVRTPVYGLAMVITSIAAVIIGPLSPNFLYKSRRAIGWLERRMHRVEVIFDAPTSLSRCFSPIGNIATIHNQWEDHNKQLSEDTVREGLSSYARAAIRHRRNHPAPFDDCGRKYPLGKAFISAAAPKPV